jgi:hypothetical protein
MATFSDNAGASTTGTMALDVVWTEFSKGVVNTFAAACNKVIDVWENTVNRIASWILEDAAKGGAVGKLLVGGDAATVGGAGGAAAGGLLGLAGCPVGVAAGVMIGGAVGMPRGGVAGDQGVLGLGKGADQKAAKVAAIHLPSDGSEDFSPAATGFKTLLKSIQKQATANAAKAAEAGMARAPDGKPERAPRRGQEKTRGAGGGEGRPRSGSITRLCRSLAQRCRQPA